MKELHIAQVEVLYSDHHRWLRGWLCGKLGCTEQAADLAHDTFLRILNTRDEVLSSIGEPRAYLVTTAKHLLIDRARRQKIEQAYMEQLTRQHDESGSAPSPETVLQAVQAIEALGSALRGLQPQMIDAFTLHYVQGRSQKEISELLTVSLRTVQNWLAQALLQCYHALGPA